jgi:hypothetical protein
MKTLAFLGFALALAMGCASSLFAQVPLAPNAPVVSIEINLRSGMSGSGGGTEIDLSHDYKSDGGASSGGAESNGIRQPSRSVTEHCEVLSYDAGHVRLSVRLTNNKGAPGKLSGGSANYSTVVNNTPDKPVTLTPFKDTTVVLSMKARNPG